MKALQLHYTSCRRGQSGSPGFQVRASSPGIRPDEQREIERRGVYRPPRGVPAEPTPEEVARDFPRAFRSYTLESGRRALTFSCYTGKDYSGRWGNFFAQTLVLDEANGDRVLWPGTWPIDYYEWEGWRHGPEPGEDEGLAGNSSPPPLPPAELVDAPQAESFRLAELQGFLSEEPGRRELLARMGRAVLLGRETSRPLVVRADGLDGPFWVASILKLFPPRHAWELSCSTYQDDPRGSAAVNATVAGTDFSFSEAERSYQFYMFDPAEGIASEVPEDDGDYPALAARWLAEEPETLEAFFGSLHRFEPFPLDAGELLAAADLFRAGVGDVAGLDASRLAELLAFAERRATRDGRVALLEELGEVLLRSPDPGSLAGDARVLRFLAEAADATEQLPHRQLAFRVWLRWLEESLAAGRLRGRSLRRPPGRQGAARTERNPTPEGGAKCLSTARNGTPPAFCNEPGPAAQTPRGAGLDALGRSWRDLRQILGDYERDLAVGFLEPEQFGQFVAHLPELSTEPLGWLLDRTWECLEILGRAPCWEQEEVRALVRALMAAGQKDDRSELAGELILRPGRSDAEALVGLCREILRAGDPDLPGEGRRQSEVQVGRALGKALSAESSAVAGKVRRLLEAAERWDVLYGEWHFRLAGAHDPAEAFTTYDREVLEALPRYRGRARGWVVESLLSTLGEERAAAQAARWVASDEVDTLSSELQQTCVTLANRRVSLDLEDSASERLAVRVEAKAKLLDLRLQPNHPLLRRLLCEIRDTGSPPRGMQDKDLQAALEGIEAEPYRRFLEGSLLPSLESVRNLNEHRGRLLAVYREPLQEVFVKVYSLFFGVKRSARELGPLQAGVKLWLFFDPADRDSLPLVSLEREILEAIVRGLRRLPERSFRVLQRRLDQAKLADRQQQRWRRIEEQVCAPRTGILRLLFGSGRRVRDPESRGRSST